MWFLFGFVTLTGFVAYNIHKRLDATWNGTPGNNAGVEYQTKLKKGKYGSINEIKLSVDAPKEWSFRLKRESWIDRFCKRIGLSEEHHVGCDQFDNLIYIVSDNPNLAKAIEQNEVFRSTAAELFKLSKSYLYKTNSIRCQQGKLWLEACPGDGFEESDVDLLAKNAVPKLSEISKALSDATCPKRETWKDPFVWKASVILGVSTGLAFNGGAHLLRFHWDNIPFTVDSWNLIELSAFIGIGICSALVVGAIYSLGKSARTHLVLIELLTIGLFGSISTAYTELRDFNIDYDTSAPQRYEATVLNKAKRRSRRSGTRYYIYVKDWNNRASESVEIKVPSSLYTRTSIGRDVNIIQRAGKLGYRWVEKIDGYN